MYQHRNARETPHEKLILLGEDNGKSFSWKRRRHDYFRVINEVAERTSVNGPAGLLHVWLLSKLVGRAIRVWKSDRVVCTFGKAGGHRPGIDVEYHDVSPQQGVVVHQQPSLLGHWSLRGGRNPVVADASDIHQHRHGGSSPGASAIGNDCLYDVIASQTGIDSRELRSRAARAMRRWRRGVALHILANAPTTVGGGVSSTIGTAGLVVDRNASSSYDEPTALAARRVADAMLGGASYVGSSPRDAQRLLDESQQGQCHPEGRSGHPRGHASYPGGGRSEDSVESYSFSRWRSGFLSRDDQDIVCHYTLITNRARDLMAQLNNSQYKVADHIHRSNLDFDPLPKAQIWSSGQPSGAPSDFNTVCLVGKHFYNRQNDPGAPLFILTFYPII